MNSASLATALLLGLPAAMAMPALGQEVWSIGRFHAEIPVRYVADDDHDRTTRSWRLG